MIRFPLTLLAALLVAAAAPAGAQQGPDFSKAEIKTTDLGHRTYALEGPGGNITVVVGADGVILVDSEYAPLHDKIRSAVAKLSDQPIRYVVDTHFHGDHTGGNAAFSKDGATVVAQVNVKRRLAAGTTNGLTGAKTAPVAAEALPAQTYEDALRLKLKDRSVQLHHPANAHTDGDTYVWIADANVLATGDTVTIGRYPNIDFANGGSIGGMIAASEQYLKLTNDRSQIVPGHGPVASKAQLAHYHDMLVTARERMAKLIDEGEGEADVVAARPFSDFDKELGATDQQAQNFIRVVYHSLKQT
jgi:glyoxylase-like metal-dependent hydrolase (beta-lactamase superfamily II)